MSRNSTIEPGQPCTSTSGSASGSGDRSVERVHSCAVDLGEELLVGVQARFGPPPVVLVAPVRHELVEVRAVGAVVPSRVGNRGRQARPHESFVEILEHVVGDRDPERLERQ